MMATGKESSAVHVGNEKETSAVYVESNLKALAFSRGSNNGTVV